MSPKELEKKSYAWALSDSDSKGQEICIFNKKLDISDADGHWSML